MYVAMMAQGAVHSPIELLSHSKPGGHLAGQMNKICWHKRMRHIMHNCKP